MAKSQPEIPVVFGIHVGNTSACVACYRDGKAQVIANDVGDRITPAVVAVTENETVVGTSAKAGIARNNASTVIHNKKVLNDAFDDSSFAEFAESKPYKMTRDHHGVKYILRHGEQTLHATAETIAVALYTKLFEIASSSAKTDSDLKVVLCCPLHFSQTTRCNMMHTAEEAGFEVLQVIGEPSAAALAYSIGVQNPEEEIMCLVYRVGGLSLDVSIVDERSGMYSIEYTAHISELGGDKFTNILTDYLAEEYRKKCKLDPSESRRSMAKLRAAAESCKHVLSMRDTAHCFVESLCEGVDFSYNITRARFENLIYPIMQDYLDPVHIILQKANMTSQSIQKVLLSGGTTKVPNLQQALKNVFPHAEFSNSMSPDEVIAIGAARHASYLSGVCIDPECQHLSHEIPAVTDPICYRRCGQKEMRCIVVGRTPVPCRRFKTVVVEPAEDVTFEIVEKRASTCVLGVLGKLSMGRVESQTQVNLEVCVNSVGGLTAVLTDCSGQKKASFKLDPPLE